MGAALAKVADQRLDAYAGEKLFWTACDQDFEWLNCTGSTEVAAFGGLRLKPRDLSKLGQLVANDGRWNAKQVLPAGWMVESTIPRINTHINTERYGSPYYAYQWWLGRCLLSGHELPLIAAFGNGGQRLFVVPELDLVVAINAAHYGSLLQALIPAAILNQFVLPAVNDYQSHSMRG